MGFYCSGMVIAKLILCGLLVPGAGGALAEGQCGFAMWLGWHGKCY